MLLPLLAFTAIHQASDIPLVSGVGISGVTQGGRVPAPIDMVQNEIILGKWNEPHVGDALPGARGGERKWEDVKANKDGVFEGGPTQGGYIYTAVDSDVEKPMLLHASGDTMVYINGEPRGGDPYSFGYLKIPFLLKKGHNSFLFSCGRGRLQAKLLPAKQIELNTGDMTLPDVLTDDRQQSYFAAIPVINASSSPLTGFHFTCEVDGQKQSSAMPAVEAMSLRKCPFLLPAGSRTPGDHKAIVRIYSRTEREAVAEAEFTVSVRKPTDHYKRTFVSQIDGSVQYYAVAPSLKPSKDNALILTVHGASVEATNQANAYKSKDWCTIVAPTNRRPYGFDWEDWGRMDAMEVWNLAKKEFPHDPLRTILTGHSMGGHGAWTLGLTYPNEFAAIGPSAGWISFWSYAGGWEPRDPNLVEQMLRRSMNSSDTLQMLYNARLEDIFILHGDKDDNVPVEQARTMKANLESIGAKFEYHEEPGAGHWWGDQCVDWPPMFEMFSKARLTPKSEWLFTTVNPAVSGTCREITIDQQMEPMKRSTVKVRTEERFWGIETGNVKRFRITVPTDQSIVALEVNGQQVWDSTQPGTMDPKVPGRRIYEIEFTGGSWVSARPLASSAKSSKRSGPFKLAFQNRMVLVVGTHGTLQEDTWGRNKARFDAEQWYYRGNGAVDIIRDDEIGRYKDRNLILYGNSETNSAFKLLEKCPVQITRKAVTVGGKTFPDSAALYLYPQGSRLIAVVGGTSMVGLQYTDRMPYFTSGVAYPDWTVLPLGSLTAGSKGVGACGFFNNEWKFDEKQCAWR